MLSTVNMFRQHSGHSLSRVSSAKLLSMMTVPKGHHRAKRSYLVTPTKKQGLQTEPFCVGVADLNTAKASPSLRVRMPQRGITKLSCHSDQSKSVPIIRKGLIFVLQLVFEIRNQSVKKIHNGAGYEKGAGALAQVDVNEKGSNAV